MGQTIEVNGTVADNQPLFQFTHPKKMVSILVKIVSVVLIILLVYHLFVSIDLNRVIRWIRLLNTTRTMRRLIEEEVADASPRKYRA